MRRRILRLSRGSTRRAEIKFEAPLIRPKGTGTWTYLVLPISTEKVFGTKSRIQVKGKIDGVPIRSTLLPSGGGRHFLVVKKELREAIGKSAGGVVSVFMELDASPRAAIVPDDFSRALGKNARARAAFNRLSYSHQREYIEWIESAKKTQTRAGRIKKAIEMVARSETLR